MISELVKLIQFLDGRANNSLLFLENSDCSKDLDVTKLFVVKASECHWDSVLVFVIEKDIKDAGVVVDLKDGSCWLFVFVDDSSNYYDFVDGFSINFKDVVRSGRSVVDHFDGHRREHFVFLLLFSLFETSHHPWKHRHLVVSHEVRSTLGKHYFYN
jgi:hypothetical protein